MTRQRKPRRLPEGSSKDEAFATALKALNRRERSTAEIRERLRDRDFDEETIEDAIARLTETGTLDDERFAHCFATDKRELSGWGEERITAELIERGVDRGLAEEAGREGFTDQVERAAGLLSERADPLDDDAARNRALGFLTRRGFAYEVAYDAIRENTSGRR